MNWSGRKRGKKDTPARYRAYVKIYMLCTHTEIGIRGCPDP